MWSFLEGARKCSGSDVFDENMKILQVELEDARAAHSEIPKFHSFLLIPILMHASEIVKDV